MGLESLGPMMQGLGGVTSAAGQLTAGMYASRAADRNARLAEQAAQTAADDTRRVGRSRLSHRVAQTLARGVTLEGSPLQVLADEAANIELDAQRQLYGGAVQALGYREGGRQAKVAGQIGAGSTLLTSSGKLWQDWQKLKKPSRPFAVNEVWGYEP